MTLALLFVAAAAGGLLNSVVGGGSFVAFPALVLAGVAPISANATTTFALWPAALASAVAYRKDLTQPRAVVVTLALASFVGGALGGLLLLRTPNATFVKLIPWLMLFAAVLFTAGPAIARGVGRAGDRPLSTGALAIVTCAQLAIAIYGGYFGGGMGIMMLAVYSAFGLGDVHAMNALRTLLAILLNGVALATFVWAGAIAWRPGLLMVAGATVFGYVGAAVARRLPARAVRVFVLVVAWAMTVYFFARAWR